MKTIRLKDGRRIPASKSDLSRAHEALLNGGKGRKPSTISTAQLCVLRSLSMGWPSELIGTCLSRSGASQAEWDELVQAGLIDDWGGRIYLSSLGRRTYNKAKVGRYF